MSNLSGALLRTAFLIVFAIAGFLLGRELYVNLFSQHLASEGLQLVFEILPPVLGATLGVVLAPLAHSLFEDELKVVEGAIEGLAPAQLAGGALGLIAGLVIAFLIKSILFEFVSVAGRAGTIIAIVLYLIVAIFAAFLGARVGAKTVAFSVPSAHAGDALRPKIVDTSVLVDGRIGEIVESGFLEGAFVVPRFVLHELQAVADSSDPLKRVRGRRGLEVLTRLREAGLVEIGEIDYEDMPPGNVDARLVRLAHDVGGKLVTTDYNLNRVASVEGISVLNVNELANAVRPVVLPGEHMDVVLIREGREANQGVGYLDDGTMIVVEQGRRFVGERVGVIVTSVLQTSAGRMIFAKPKREGAA